MSAGRGAIGLRHRHGETATLLRAVRRDLRAARARDEIPWYWRYSVRLRRYAGGDALDVIVERCADAWMPAASAGCGCGSLIPGRHDYSACGIAWTHSPLGQATRRRLEALLAARLDAASGRAPLVSVALRLPSAA